MKGRERIGLFGGTFDPVHVGHLAAAEAARERLGLERVVFLPAGEPPHKPAGAHASGSDRLAMLRLATADNAHFAVDTCELDRSGPSYTVETLSGFAERQPGAELLWLLGSDSLVELHNWRQPLRLCALATLAVLLRPGWTRDVIEEWRAGPGRSFGARIVVLDVPGLDVSARALRAAMASGASVRYLVPEAVRSYIAGRGLYGAGSGEAAGDGGRPL